MKQFLRPCLSISIAFLSLASAAQENFQDGYIVLTGKDTVKGRIDFRDWVANPGRITFEDGRQGQKTGYSPGEIAAFFVNGETYRCYNVKIYPYSRNVAAISEQGSAASPYDSTCFLRLVTGGKLSLYYYRDRSDNMYFFIQRQAGAPEQLRIQTNVTEKDGISSMEKDNLYQYQLADWVGDCAATAQRPVRVDYNERSLRKLVFTYNNCGKDTVEQRPAEHGSKVVSITPLLGYFHSAVRISGLADVAKMSWPSYGGVTGGVGMLLVLPRAREQFSFFTDLLYRHFYSSSSVYQLNDFTTEQGLLDYNQVQLDIQFRYRFPTGSVRPFLNAGLSNSLIVSNKSDQNEKQSGAGQDYTYPMFRQSSGMKTFQFGFIGGGGVSIGHLSLEARVEETEGLSQLSGTSAPLTNFYLLAGFSF
jgi:hypothetical protein